MQRGSSRLGAPLASRVALCAMRIAAGLLTVLAMIVTMLVGARSARAAPFDPRGDDWEGLSQLVRIAGRSRAAARGPRVEARPS
jgi:hypothetical protein